MATNDIELSAGISVAEIKGAEILSDAISDSISKGFARSLEKRRTEFASLQKDIMAHASTTQNATDALFLQMLYNQGLGAKYRSVRSEDATRELLLGRETNRVKLSAYRLEGRAKARSLAKQELAQIQANDAISKWLGSAASVEALQEEGYSGKAGREEYAARLLAAREDLHRAYRTAEAAGEITNEDRKNYYKDLRSINKELARLNKGLPRFITDYKEATVAGAAGVALGSKASDIAASIYGNINTPFSQIRDLGNQVAKGVGGALGSVLGFLVGGPVGALVGGAAGSFIGGTGERTKAASDAAKPEAIAMLRYRSLYGNRIGAAGYNAAIMARQAGYVNAEDIMGMAAGSNTFMTAAAFGGLSEQQWLALSMMPNYYNSLVSGADVNGQMAAYARDLEALGPGMGQYFTGLLGGLGPNENIRAFVQSDSFARYLNDLDLLEQYENEQLGYASGYAGAKYREGLRNMEGRNLIFRRGTWTMSPYNYETDTSVAASAFSATADKLGYREYNPRTGRFEGNAGLVQRELNIVIEGEKVNVGTVYAAEEDLHNYMTYSVGGN